MQGVLTGFTVIATVIAVGYVIGRRGYLGQDGRTVLTRLAFNVATPALLFTMLAGADLSVVLSTRLLVTATATAAAAAVFAVVAGLLLRWDAGRVTIGALCSSYVNAGNLGIPIAVYVLGGVLPIRPGSRGPAPHLAALSSLADAPRLLPPPPCDARHRTPLPDPA